VTQPEGSAKEALNAFLDGKAAELMTDAPIPRDEKALPHLQQDGDDLQKKLEEAIDAADQGPEKTWEERLNDLGVSKEEAFKIVDEVMNKGTFTRAYAVTKKTTVEFRTRNFSDHERLQHAIEADSPQFMGTMSIIMSKYNLAASLARYGTQTFELNKDGIPEKAFDFIAKLPYMVFTVLLRKLQKFDELVLTVMDDGALENF
jgi:hypothetical protein